MSPGSPALQADSLLLSRATREAHVKYQEFFFFFFFKCSKQMQHKFKKKKMQQTRSIVVVLTMKAHTANFSALVQKSPSLFSLRIWAVLSSFCFSKWNLFVSLYNLIVYP